MSNYITGRNPVRELLRAGNRTVSKILLSNQSRGSAIEEIIKLAKEKQIPMHHVPPERFNKLNIENNQGVAAEISAVDYLNIYELWNKVKNEAKPLIVILDEIEDPHNLGAIIRSAVTLGANGIVIGKWRSVGLTETVARTSAGASEHIPIARVSNISDCINVLKKSGVWIIGTETNTKPLATESFSFPLAIVIGSEGKGLRRLVKERCDDLVAIPQTSKISSLNASCAASIVLYEIFKQKTK
ncbi:23S rRNA (guanosine(2251)-2'-O)-methyltransferase RlmB [Elusimicrobiota bacterium]